MPVYNFSAGPAALPDAVLQQAREEFLDYRGTGCSVMTLSHRSDLFMELLQKAEADLRDLLAIPNHYRILFLQGGASAQFTQVALNLAEGFERVDSVVTGNWSAIAHTQMGCLSNVNVHLAADGAKLNFQDLPAPETWDVDKHSAFIHYISNETVHGLQYADLPIFGTDMPPVVCDMSSEILSREFDVNDFGLIYAGAQKNVGPSGATIVIVREDLLERCSNRVPDVWSYRAHIEKQGMYNTPATYPIYISGLVFAWLKRIGGVAHIAQINAKKAAKLYAAIDGSDGFFVNPVAHGARSQMNVIFSTGKTELDNLFVREAYDAGLHALAGYRTMGGMRASIYNAMPLEGVQTLIDFMRDFQARYA